MLHSIDPSTTQMRAQTPQSTTSDGSSWTSLCWRHPTRLA